MRPGGGDIPANWVRSDRHAPSNRLWNSKNEVPSRGSNEILCPERQERSSERKGGRARGNRGRNPRETATGTRRRSRGWGWKRVRGDDIPARVTRSY